MYYEGEECGGRRREGSEGGERWMEVGEEERRGGEEREICMGEY